VLGPLSSRIAAEIAALQKFSALCQELPFAADDNQQQASFT
jgi:hypothetical protein